MIVPRGAVSVLRAVSLAALAWPLALGIAPLSASTDGSAAAATASAEADAELWPQRESKLAPDAEIEGRIDALIAAMSVEQKVGQIIQADIASVTPDDV